ncbi:hypothetical protein [Sulfobacillus thermosulfidooxidans]|uniref:Phage holin family protein n=2 Tax=Sulfobacillus thermosulfidooxidans TaxID=28034 RepID=A0A1W1W9I2_SULTA|nr:hypothetical protein [Sulfobacillus thermosulfidooxidans]OLZ10971.1 hypothetical protein BFX05_09535 [Sulfobacillus thermosulfidooxidans]OLZ14459.1 hypothetical protein BFX06_09360 [Sulfobacillus thermosulfidooxidans]OLZ19202.1 hypothetical protein BFX07_05755 [Sulfobacillus thermosulfidooxidans]PSR28414.1 MAG: hypothetical protein C7B47_04400 [Sulfobacillus thermosulfidooxidans]SMC02968.1 membrane protein of unknown function [Sulfobacillus thermosulfidooxidans DSM 9293]
MNWKGAIARFIMTLMLLEIFRYTLSLFPGISLSEAVIIALFVAGIGYLVDEMFGGYISPPGRGFIGFIVTTTVVSIYFTHYVYPIVHTFAYVFDSIAIGVLVGLADALFGRAYQKSQRTKA